jgi:hypothetical protein
MASMIGQLARFAASPQGRKLAGKAKRIASDPKNRAKIDEYRRKLANRQK